MSTVYACPADTYATIKTQYPGVVILWRLDGGDYELPLGGLSPSILPGSPVMVSTVTPGLALRIPGNLVEAACSQLIRSGRRVALACSVDPQVAP